MSEMSLDKGIPFPDLLQIAAPERPFKLALAGSLLIHAFLLAFVPGFRPAEIKLPKVLDVQIIAEEPLGAPPRPNFEPAPQRLSELEPSRPAPVVDAAPPPPRRAEPPTPPAAKFEIAREQPKPVQSLILSAPPRPEAPSRAAEL